MADDSIKIPKGWKKTTLGDVADIQTGPFGSQLHNEDYVPNGTPIITVENLVNNSILYTEDTPKVSDEDKLRLEKYTLEKGDIVFSRVGSVDRSGFVSEREVGWLFSGRLLRVRPKETMFDKYVYYWISQESIKEFIRKIAVGATMPSINTALLSQVPIAIFPLSEQRAIAAVLSSLDDKIELLREQNKTLEAMAQTIFKEWFVNFNFPDEKGKPYKSSGGKMIDSELGQIPQGWRVGCLSEIANFLNGLALQKYPPDTPTYYLPVIKIKELNSGISEQTDKATTKLDKKYIVNDGDILFSWSGSLMVDIWKYGKGALNQHLFKVTSNDFPKWFYFYWIKEHLPSFQQIAASKAVTMGHIKRHHLDDALLTIPDDVVLKRANQNLAPVFNKFINNNAQINTLSILRDVLLPKLMKGEIRVKGFNN